MAKRIKVGTTVLIAVLSALVVGGAVGLIASASNGFDKDVLDEWGAKKQDYVKINLTNKYNEKTLDTSSALEFLNYDNEVFSTVDLVSGVVLDNGAMVVSAGGALTATFDDQTYNRVKITASANYVEVFEDEDGKIKQDIFGNDIVQSITSQDSTFTLNGHDPVTFEGAEDDEYPEIISKTFSYDEAVEQLSFTVADGDLRITSIELWNVEIESEDKTEDTKTSSAA